MPGAEVLLMLLALGLYVFDAAWLLYANEAVLMPAGRGRWKAAFGSDQTRLLGRELLLPDLLAPHRPVFRLSWRFEGDRSEAVSGDWARLADALRPAAILVWGMAAALFVLLPLGLFSRIGAPLVLAAVAMLYLLIAATLLWLLRHRESLGLSGRRLAALAFEALICPPLAINLLRKVAAGQAIAEPFPAAAQRLLAAEDWLTARAECLARVDEEIDAESGDSPRLTALQAQRERFRAEVAA